MPFEEAGLDPDGVDYLAPDGSPDYYYQSYDYYDSRIGDQQKLDLNALKGHHKNGVFEDKGENKATLSDESKNDNEVNGVNVNEDEIEVIDEDDDLFFRPASNTNTKFDESIDPEKLKLKIKKVGDGQYVRIKREARGRNSRFTRWPRTRAPRRIVGILDFSQPIAFRTGAFVPITLGAFAIVSTGSLAGKKKN